MINILAHRRSRHVWEDSVLIIPRTVVKDPPSHPEDLDMLDGPARRWSPEMDEALRSCQERAESVGILMTPIMVVEGEVKHHGSVPSVEQIKSWLS